MSFDDRLTHSVADDSFMLLWAGTTDGTFEFAAMSWPKIFEVACKLGLVNTQLPPLEAHCRTLRVRKQTLDCGYLD